MNGIKGLNFSSVSDANGRSNSDDKWDISLIMITS